jgi:hypothetical protein
MRAPLRWSIAVLAVIRMMILPATATAQSRGVYPLGMTAVGSGVTPDPGFTYANQLLFYARDESKANDGSTLPVSGRNAVIMDMNSFIWVSERTLLGGAHYSAVATLPIARNQLVSDVHGPLSGGGGFADSYYLPFILGWNNPRASFRALAGFLAPTGRFAAGASDNVGSGYWTPTLSAGQTIQVTRDQSVTLSAFQLYEFHSSQQGTGTRPGDTINLDYSLIHTFRFDNGPGWQLGVAGYEQRQTTAKTGASVTAEESNERYAINAFGIASGLVFPNQRLSFGVRFFEEFANRAAYQGYSFQLSGSVSF